MIRGPWKWTPKCRATDRSSGAPFISPRIGSAALAATTLTQEQIEVLKHYNAHDVAQCHDAKKQKGGLRLDFRDG